MKIALGIRARHSCDNENDKTKKQEKNKTKNKRKVFLCLLSGLENQVTCTIHDTLPENIFRASSFA